LEFNLVLLSSSTGFNFFLIGENDASTIKIEQIFDNRKTQYPENDGDLIDILQPIVEQAITGKLTEAIMAWLKLRSETPLKYREMSIWEVSIFDAFNELEISAAFNTHEQYIEKFRSVSHNLRPKLQDRAPINEVIAFQKIFQHQRPFIPRLYRINKLMRKPKPHKPLNPPPAPPPNKH